MEDKEQKIKISFETNADQVGGKVDGLTDSTNQTTDSQVKASKSAKTLKTSLQDLDNPISNAASGFKAMLVQMKAIVMNPLGLILAAVALVVGGLVSVFKTFQPLVDKVEQSFAALGAVLNVIKNAAFSVLTGAQSLGSAFSGLSNDMETAARVTRALVKAQQDLEDVLQQQNVQTATNRAAINKLTVEAKNRTLTEEQRLVLLEKASLIENEDYKQRVKNSDEEVRLARVAIAIKGKFSKEEVKILKEQGVAAKELAESKNGNFDEEFNRLEKSLINRISLEDESTSRLEKNQNKQDALADAQQGKREKAITDAQIIKDKKDAADKLAEDKRLALIKEGSDAETAIRKTNEDLQDKTEEQKLARQKERALQEIEALKKKGIDTAELTKLNAEKFAALETELKVKTEEDERKRKADSLFKDLELIISNKDAENQVRIDAINQEQALLQSLFDAKLLKEEEFNSRQSILSAARTEIAQKEADEKKQVDATMLKLAEDLEAAKLSITDKALGLFGMLAGKNKKLQKAALVAESAVAIGRTITATSAASAAAVASGAAIAIPTGGASVLAAGKLVAANKISAGVNIATIIASTSKALSALGGGGGGGLSGGTPSGGGNATSSTPQVSFQASSENQISSSIARNTKDQAPIKAFVVGKDITTQQSLDNNRIKSNSI